MKTLFFLTVIFFACVARAMDPVYSELDAEWRADLEAKRSRIHQLVSKHYHKNLKSDASDLPVIQKVVDDHLIAPDDIVGYQALGVVFGDSIAHDINAEWKQVKDEYGENPVLKIRGKNAAVGALTILSKRIEEKETVNVLALHENLIRDIKRLEHEFGADKK